MKNLCAIISLLLLQIVYAQMDIVNIDALIDRGEFRTAKEIIAGELARPCPDTRRYELLFCLERMDRIKKDFNKSQDDIIAYLKKYFPSINASMLETWKKTTVLR